MVATVEAVLIEGLEPGQNRKRGDDFQAIEFNQVEDPEVEKQRRQSNCFKILANQPPLNQLPNKYTLQRLRRTSQSSLR